MIYERLNFQQFLDKLQRDPYSEYSYEAVEWIFEYLDQSEGWEMDIPMVRSMFTEVSEDNWNEYSSSNQYDWYYKTSNSYVTVNE